MFDLMLPTSNTKIGQIQAGSQSSLSKQPPPKPPKPRNLDDSFWKEHREKAAATLALTSQPPMLYLAIGIIGANPDTTGSVRLSNAGLRDEHLPPHGGARKA